jgi:hypothetical protein
VPAAPADEEDLCRYERAHRHFFGSTGSGSLKSMSRETS